MIDRRTVLATGFAATSVAATGLVGFSQAAAARGRGGVFDALLVDRNIALPRQMAEFVDANSATVPVVAIHLDAASHAGLNRVFAESRAVLGLSSGATLFCLERIAWDHGFRLVGRSEASDRILDGTAPREDIAVFLAGAHRPTAPQAVAYRPSHSDGALHLWVLQKSARTRLSAAGKA